MGNRSRSLAIAAATCGLALTSQVATEREALACGGCFHEAPPVQNPTQGVADITDERMLLSVSETQTTLYDQIRYTGTPTSFAWVLPIKGTVDVGLSADIVFDTIDALTTTQITGPLPPVCAPPPYCGGYGADDESGGGGGCSSSDDSSAVGASEAESDSSTSGSGSGLGSTPPPVTVTKQENVGPYETVQLHSSDPNALNAWLTKNGFVIPADVTPIIDAYVSEGFDFLAMRLLPNEGVQAMRPVRVTMPGASLSLPLRMAAIGTGATVGITIWVMATGRYEPQNFPFFHIEDSQLIWDFSTQSSNYTTLRAQNEANLVGKGWEIESSIDLNAQSIATSILSGGASVSGIASTASADDDYLPITVPNDDGGVTSTTDGGADASDDGGTADAGFVTESADDVRTQDINTLLNPAAASGIVRVTRMRSDISHAAMTSDFLLQASADQSQLSDDRTVSQSTHAPVCPTYPACPTSTSGTNSDSSGSSSGCAVRPRPRNDTGVFLTFFGLFGLVFTRVIRIRRRR
ncbi:MAG: DUF2330 domain-containing protein [Polyangiaceae bacterium]